MKYQICKNDYYFYKIQKQEQNLKEWKDIKNVDLRNSIYSVDFYDINSEGILIFSSVSDAEQSIILFQKSDTYNDRINNDNWKVVKDIGE